MPNPLPLAPGARRFIVWDFASQGYLQAGDSLSNTHQVVAGPGVSVVSSEVQGSTVVALVEMSAGLRLGAQTWADLTFNTTLGERDTARFPLVCQLAAA